MTNHELPNRLINEKSPYLLQHAYNPVDWYPWGKEAFEKAIREDKPIFLSIGYSTCHWCHVMENESFENEAVAEVLNRYFVSIKVDREERPDIDNIYMRVCQAYTGGGGWPTSVFMTGAQVPFFAGTYFPRGQFLELLQLVRKRWAEDKQTLTGAGEELAAALGRPERAGRPGRSPAAEEAVSFFRQSFDSRYGGFGRAPKFPSPQNLLFLLYTAPDMAEKTLLQMYKGGIFDHVGYGFSRYSTDRFWLVPHFEKMLYDNALLSLAYLMAYERTGRELWRVVAEKTLLYIKREMTSPGGGFYSAQDADSGGGEGRYYVFTPEEITRLLGETDGRRFNEYFGLTEKGNFDGLNIPNLIGRDEFDPGMDELLSRVYEYRRARIPLRTDKKILTAWNGLMIAAYAAAYRILGKEEYRKAAEAAVDFIERELTEWETIFSSVTDGRRGCAGFLDDYAFTIFALLCLHQATLDDKFLQRAAGLAGKAIREFFDGEDGGFFFSGEENEKLLFRTKETYDGAMPSGNSVMAYNLSRLTVLTKSDALYDAQKKQEAFMDAEAAGTPAGYGFYLYSRLPVREIACVLQNPEDRRKIRVKSDWTFQITKDPRYPPVNGKTTFYVCREGACLPPSNELPE